MAEMAETGEAAGYRLITNDTGRVFRVGETPNNCSVTPGPPSSGRHGSSCACPGSSSTPGVR